MVELNDTSLSLLATESDNNASGQRYGIKAETILPTGLAKGVLRLVVATLNYHAI